MATNQQRACLGLRKQILFQSLNFRKLSSGFQASIHLTMFFRTEFLPIPYWKDSKATNANHSILQNYKNYSFNQNKLKIVLELNYLIYKHKSYPRIIRGFHQILI